MPNNTKKKKKPEILEETTFIVMILRPANTGEDPHLLAVLTGWCVIAAHGLNAAIGHTAKIDFGGGVDLSDAAWTDVSSGGKMAKLADGQMIQVLPAPLYVVKEEESLVAPPYMM
ncbi:hypothetical protein LCGC14_2555600 [marine sediment metagenome]|uniref:Uncharacterized protein n=1 Tax=marine sediment metagenome TaxID=412755 RepID=A0A0F9AM42_9ZZZZ